LHVLRTDRGFRVLRDPDDVHVLPRIGRRQGQAGTHLRRLRLPVHRHSSLPLLVRHHGHLHLYVVNQWNCLGLVVRLHRLGLWWLVLRVHGVLALLDFRQRPPSLPPLETLQGPEERWDHAAVEHLAAVVQLESRSS
ncbi:hypothetical protein PMAYCL1PPCAC_01921, partial [Pristionchus mayeri]